MIILQILEKITSIKLALKAGPKTTVRTVANVAKIQTMLMGDLPCHDVALNNSLDKFSISTW